MGSKTQLFSLTGAALICVVLGSIHAFSVFLEPLETALGLSRATVSLTYSFALVALTATVLIGPKFYSAISPARLFITAGLVGVVGTGLAGFSEGLFGIWLGYSLGFGVANGLGYGIALQFAAMGHPKRKGFAMGVVTAAYALGAAISPYGFVEVSAVWGFSGAMYALAFALAVSATAAAHLAKRSGIRFESTVPRNSEGMPSPTHVVRLWIAYGAGVAAGLMTIAHAAGIADIAGIAGWKAPAVLAVCNLAGSLLGGMLVDRYQPRLTFLILPVMTILGLGILGAAPEFTLIGLGFVGFGYGGTIAAYPAIIANTYPGSLGPRVYGLVFTAWGTAGLIAPWLAGALFDQAASYSAAIWCAVALALISIAMARQVFAKASNAIATER